MFKQIGPLEIGIILVIILIIFGAGRLPQIGGAIGKGIRDFRKSLKTEEESKLQETKEPSQTKESTEKQEPPTDNV